MAGENEEGRVHEAPTDPSRPANRSSLGCAATAAVLALVTISTSLPVGTSGSEVARLAVDPVRREPGTPSIGSRDGVRALDPPASRGLTR